MTMPKAQGKRSASSAQRVDMGTPDANASRRAQQAAVRHRRFTIQMQELAQALDRLKQVFDAQADSLPMS